MAPASFYEERDTICFARTILHKPFLQRMQNALAYNRTTQSAVAYPTDPIRFLIESASVTTTLRNDSSQHVTVHVFEVRLKDNTVRFAPSGMSVGLDNYFDGENTVSLSTITAMILFLPYTNATIIPVLFLSLATTTTRNLLRIWVPIQSSPRISRSYRLQSVRLSPAYVYVQVLQAAHHSSCPQCHRYC